MLLGGMSVVAEGSWLAFLSWALTAQLNRFLPTVLGGPPRRFLFYSATATREDTKKVLELVEGGKLKPLLDSVWKVEDGKKVRVLRWPSHCLDSETGLTFDPLGV